MSSTPRLNRLFAADGKCLQLAMDHAQFNGWELLDGVRDMAAVLARAARSGVDAILLSPGQAGRLQGLRLDRKPALVVRSDVANVYDARKPERGFSLLHSDAVETALRLDAAAVLLNLFYVPEDPAIHEQCVANICRIKPVCLRYGMPLMVEPLVLVEDRQSGRYTLSGRKEWLLPLHRQAIELGADILKSDPTDSPENYRELVELAGGIPLLPRGGGRVGDREILARTISMMQAGASGVVYGRNIFQHPRMETMVDVLRAVVHEGLGLESALARLEAS